MENWFSMCLNILVTDPNGKAQGLTVILDQFML